jgi:probable rRNA maturation factor
LGCAKPTQLSILLTADREVARLNKTYRKKAGPTDVLSFAMSEGEPAPSKILGDVVISVERAEKQAIEIGVSLAEEVLRLLIHGVLHLCGYEHEGVSKRKAAQMRKKEDELYDAVYGILG